MTLSELQHEFPGLFEPPGCETASAAEQYADRVASRAGLIMRAAAWTSGGDSRRIDYMDPAEKLRLQVEICLDEDRGSTPFYLFRCSGERVDAQLTMRSPRNARAKPLSFQREAQTMMSQLRSLEVQPDGRIKGRLKKWDAYKGAGVIECLPGAFVSLSSSELPVGLRVAQSDWLSFTVTKSADRQKAINVRKCSPR